MGLLKRSTSSSIFLFLEKPLFAFGFAFITYFVLSALDGHPFRVSESSYFNYLADAFLHGQLHLRVIPETVHDLSLYHGNYYLYWPPMPAVIMMPFIAIFGLGFSDVFFNVIIASLNIGVMAILLRSADRAGVIKVSPYHRGMLLLFLAVGTVHVLLTLLGEVWYTAQLLGFLLVELAYLSAIELDGQKSFWVTGLLIACAMLTRNHLLFTGIWPAYYLIAKHWNHRPRLPLFVVSGLLPSLILGLLFLGYNYARFGNPFDLGLRYHNMAPNFIVDYQRYGAFNLHYVPINLYYQYIHYPFPFSEETYMGNSLFLLSPVFFLSFAAIFRNFSNRNIVLLLISILATSIPILLLMGSGWVQYGPRYTLDFTVPLLLLTAAGVETIPTRLLLWLIAISILHYIPGIFLYVAIGL